MRDTKKGSCGLWSGYHGDARRGAYRALERARDEVLAERYRATLKSWFVVDLDAEIAESTARLRAACKLKLADAVQAASALAIGADALVTHDRDFSALRDLRVLGVETRKSPQ